MTKPRLRLILGDQLNASHSWFLDKCEHTYYVIAELGQEAAYTKHHIQKVSAFFAAMAGFAKALEQAGHKIVYLTLDETEKYSDLPALLSDLIQQYNIKHFDYQLPDEYRLRKQMSDFCLSLGISTTPFETEHFYLKDSELTDYFSANKKHRMEAFYRKMRVRFNVLMAGEEPEGEQWNFDADNRKKLKVKDFIDVPEPLLFSNDVTDILSRIKRHHIITIGEAHRELLWPINRQQSLVLLTYFCRYCLVNFGRFQDAMTGKLDTLTEQKQWSLYHSRISFALNSKMLSPQLVVEVAIESFRQSNGAISLAQIEGFVRQIIGWREFVRGIYWLNMPDYAQLNHASVVLDGAN